MALNKSLLVMNDQKLFVIFQNYFHLGLFYIEWAIKSVVDYFNSSEENKLYHLRRVFIRWEFYLYPYQNRRK